MTKIREVIKINSGYTSYVDLSKEFFYYDEEQNRGRIERYMPITAHRKAFEQIANALNPKDRRFYFLSGSYGTGKSHLCLMIGNYFARQSNSLEMATFFKNYETAQKEVLLKPGETLDEKPASSLSASRKEAKYLVAICRYGLNLELEGVILRAIQEALEKEGAGVQLDTHYREALRKIKNWEDKKSEKHFFNDLESELKRNHPDWTVSKVKQGLKEINEGALRVFKQVHKEITDSDFSFSKDNLQDILIDIVTNDKFKKSYKGIAIIYDEFGYALDGGLVNLNRLHEFAQFCATSGLKHLPIIFIGTGHKPFPKHGQVGDAVHYNTLKDRVTEIALQTEGMEDLIGAIVQQKKDNPIWKKEVSPHTDTFAQFPVECKRLRIFAWLTAPKLKNNIIENIYPMHPFATYALLQMAKELGSDNRSVFKFFAPEFETGEESWANVQEYSYPWFIENNQILSDGQLKLYTADLLFDYFKDGIIGENRKQIRLERIRTSIANYEATLRELNRYILSEKETKLFSEIDELFQKILKVMLVNEIISNEEIPIINTIENILFTLNIVKPSDKKTINDRVDVLCRVGVLYKNENQVYEFRRSDFKDIRRLVNEFKANPENYPNNVLEKFLQFTPLKADERYLEAKDYNSTYNEDKRLLVRFILPSALDQTFRSEGKTMTFFEKMELDRKQAGYGRDGYEGTALYIFSETDEAVEQAKKFITKNSQDRVLIGAPKKGMPVTDNVLTLMAIEHIQSSKEAENFGPLENAQLIEIRKTAEKQLLDLKESYLNNKFMDWFATKGMALQVQEGKKYDPANSVMRKIFDGKRDTFSHSEFNKIHIKNDGTIRRIMTEAGDILADLTKTINIDWTYPENRGSTKYIRKCFVDQQVLKTIRTEGDFRYFDVEREINKFKKSLPAYAQMLDDLKSHEGKGAISCKEFFQHYFEDYGQGEIAITLFLLIARRMYGDSLRFKREEHALTDINLDSAEKAIDLVTGEEPNAVLIFESISEEEKKYFALLCQIFSKDGIEAGKICGINDAYNAITLWWKGLPIIAKSGPFYDDKFKIYIQTLNRADTTDPFVFIKYDILRLFGIAKDEKLSEQSLKLIKQGLEEFKTTASEILANHEQHLLKKTSEVFASKGSLDIDIQEAIKGWYDGLDSYQKDQHSKFHNNDSKILITKLNLSQIRELLFNIYPEAFGFGVLSNWSSNNTDDYINKLKQGKIHIEQNKSSVGGVSMKFENSISQENDTVTYSGKLGVTTKPEKTGEAMYYTDDGSDPSDEKSDRKRVKAGETLYIEGGNRTLKLVACDHKGTYGTIKTIKAIDDSKKYEIKPPRQAGLFEKTVTFIFPKDKEGARVTITSLFHGLSTEKIMSIEELKEIVNEILKKMRP